MHPLVWLLVGAVLSPILLTLGHIFVYLVGIATLVVVAIIILKSISGE